MLDEYGVLRRGRVRGHVVMGGGGGGGGGGYEVLHGEHGARPCNAMN